MAHEENLAFGVWLEREIYRRHLTKSELAAKLGVSPSVITQWTSGETLPSHPRVLALAALLGVSCYEIYLRLGYIQARPELDIDWEIFITRVEQDGVDFKRFVLNGLDDMRAAWLTRPRRAQAVMQVAARSLLNYSSAGFRAEGVWQEERLLYYGPIVFSDGTMIDLMLMARQESSGDYVFVAQFIGATPPESGLIRVGSDIIEAQLTGTSIEFPAIRQTEPEMLMLVVFERECLIDRA